MIVRVTYKVWSDIQAEEAYYSERSGDKVADSIVDGLVEAINKLHTRPSGKRIDGLPANYRRVTVNPFHLYYRTSQDKGYVLVFLLRYWTRKPLSPSTIKRLASEGERDSFEF